MTFFQHRFDLRTFRRCGKRIRLIIDEDQLARLVKIRTVDYALNKQLLARQRGFVCLLLGKERRGIFNHEPFFPIYAIGRHHLAGKPAFKKRRKLCDIHLFLIGGEQKPILHKTVNFTRNPKLLHALKVEELHKGMHRRSALRRRDIFIRLPHEEVRHRNRRRRLRVLLCSVGFVKHAGIELRDGKL